MDNEYICAGDDFIPKLFNPEDTRMGWAFSVLN